MNLRADAHRQLEMRSRILQAAAGSIASLGFHGMSMRDLARAAGTSLANLYNYFGSKEDILFALQSEAFATLTASAEAQLAAVSDPPSRLYVFISHHVRYVAEHPDVMHVLVHEAASLPQQQRRVIRRWKERYFGLGRDIVAKLAGIAPLAPAELERVTYSVFGMLNWIYGWYQPDLHGGPQELARSIHRVAMCGLSARCPFEELQARLDERLDALVVPPLLRIVREGLPV